MSISKAQRSGSPKSRLAKSTSTRWQIWAFSSQTKKCQTSKRTLSSRSARSRTFNYRHLRRNQAGQNGQKSARGRPQVGGKSAPGRPAENAATQDGTTSNRSNDPQPEQNAHLE